MKKIKIMLFLFLASTMFIACGGSDDTEGGSNSTSDKIIGNWKLIGSQDASGVFTAVPSCIVVFQKYSANGDFKLTFDYSGICGQDSGAETGSWVKVANSQEYAVTLASGVDTAVITFFENDTKYSVSHEGVEQVFQKQ